MFYAAALLAEVCVIYLAGSYAMSRLAVAVEGGALSRAAFYLLVAPGVAAHESAHYLVCRLTATKVRAFTPFSPKKSADGRLLLGYVEHEATNPIFGALIGIAPLVINPLVAAAITAYITPLTYPIGGDELAAFALSSPGLFAGWSYVVLTLALGAALSREDLSALPAAAVIVASLAVAIYAAGGRFEATGAIEATAVVGAQVYLVAAVASVGAATAARAMVVSRAIARETSAKGERQ